MPNSSLARFLKVFLGLLTLTTFAIAQSVYQAIVGNPEFVQLNWVTHGDLLLIVFVFNVVPAAVFALLWAFILHWNGRLAAGFLSLAFFLLLAPFLFELHKRYVSPLTHFHHNTILIFIPFAIAAAIVFRYRAEFERFLLVLSPVVVLFPALFLWRAWSEVSPVVAPPAVQAGTAAASQRHQSSFLYWMSSRGRRWWTPAATSMHRDFRISPGWRGRAPGSTMRRPTQKLRLAPFR